MSNSIGPDKRRYLRYEILDYAVLKLDTDDSQVNTVIVDISLGGLQVRSRDPLPPGAFCTIRVGCGEMAPIGLRGEIRHCKAVEDSDLFTTGVRFMPEDHEDRMAIAEYVHAIFQRQCDNLLV